MKEITLEFNRISKGDLTERYFEKLRPMRPVMIGEITCSKRNLMKQFDTIPEKITLRMSVEE